MTDEGRSQRLRSSSLREPGTRSRLQSRCAFSVAARPLMRTRIRIWNNRWDDGFGQKPNEPNDKCLDPTPKTPESPLYGFPTASLTVASEEGY